MQNAECRIGGRGDVWDRDSEDDSWAEEEADVVGSDQNGEDAEVERQRG